MKAENFPSMNSAVDSIRRQGVSLSACSDPIYLFMHVAAQKVLQKDMSIDEINNQLYLVDADDTAFKYLAKGTRDGLESLCRGDKNSNIIKFTRHERKYMELYPALEECIFGNK
jgi:hypothetical protein